MNKQNMFHDDVIENRPKQFISTTIGTIPEVENALKDPVNYEVVYNFLGYNLHEIGSDISLLISESDAAKIINEIKRFINS